MVAWSWLYCLSRSSCLQPKKPGVLWKTRIHQNRNRWKLLKGLLWWVRVRVFPCDYWVAALSPAGMVCPTRISIHQTTLGVPKPGGVDNLCTWLRPKGEFVRWQEAVNGLSAVVTPTCRVLIGAILRSGYTAILLGATSSGCLLA